MIKGDAGAESVYLWTKDKKGVNRRVAGPENASLFGRGAGEGLGVHICTGPVFVRGAQEGDVIELRIIDVAPRPSANPAYPGKASAATPPCLHAALHQKMLHGENPLTSAGTRAVSATAILISEGYGKPDLREFERLLGKRRVSNSAIARTPKKYCAIDVEQAKTQESRRGIRAIAK
jgi:hypothetical protein